jgi:tetratricopeptide (TPR) repeat protein
MSVSSRILITLSFLVCLVLTKNELAKPSYEELQEKVGQELRAKGELGSLELPSMKQITDTGIALESMPALFGYFILCSLTGGLFAWKVAIPVYRDGLNAVFTDTSMQNGWVKAKQLLAQEKYPEAIERLRQFAQDSPDDRRPILEIARIQAEELEDEAAAWKTLETAWQNPETPPTHAAAYALRLVEMHQARPDFLQARHWAEQLISKFPNTPQASQAAIAIQHMDEAEWRAKLK